MINQLSGMFGARLSLGLSKKGIALVRNPAGVRRQHTVLMDEVWQENPAHNQQHIAALCAPHLAKAGCAGMPLFVTLADEWVRFFMVTPPKNLGQLQDLQTVAAVRFQALYDEPLTGWKLEADWQLDRPFLVCALPADLLFGLQQLAQEQRLMLVSVVCGFTIAWNRHKKILPVDAWLGVVQDKSITFGAVSGGAARRLDSVRMVTIPDGEHDRSWLTDQVERIALQQNLATPVQLHLLGNDTNLWQASSVPNPAGQNAPIIVNIEKKPGYRSAIPQSPHGSLALMLSRTGLSL